MSRFDEDAAAVRKATTKLAVGIDDLGEELGLTPVQLWHGVALWLASAAGHAVAAELREKPGQPDAY